MKNNQKILDEFGKKIIDNYADDINYHNEITNVKEVLEFMESNNDWYNLIFK